MKPSFWDVAHVLTVYGGHAGGTCILLMWCCKLLDQSGGWSPSLTARLPGYYIITNEPCVCADGGSENSPMWTKISGAFQRFPDICGTGQVWQLFLWQTVRCLREELRKMKDDKPNRAWYMIMIVLIWYTWYCMICFYKLCPITYTPINFLLTGTFHF